jgi:predicted aconitase with swiveling domain
VSALDEGTLVLHGRGLGGGTAEGEALVTREAISGWGGVEPREGRIIESRHDLVGRSFAGKILVFPGAKGSSGWSGMFHMARLMGSAPAAMVFTTMNTKIALGVVVTHVPAVTDLDVDPFSVIRTGDLVRVDGDRGEVRVIRAAG